MRPDPAVVAGIVAEIAAREISPRFKNLPRGAVREKSSPNDLVTEADEAAELALKAALSAIAPDAEFIGEEHAAKDPSMVSRALQSDRAFIVDPLDGTRNFVAGIEEFGTILAYIERGETIFGIIHLTPAGKTIIAARGSGAVIDGAAIMPESRRVGPPVGFRSTGFLEGESRERIIAALRANTHSRPGLCAAYAYWRLAAGAVDFKLSSLIYPWDHVAGALLLNELGGASRFLDNGERYAPHDRVARPLLAVAPGRDWTEIAALIAGGPVADAV